MKMIGSSSSSCIGNIMDVVVLPLDYSLIQSRSATTNKTLHLSLPLSNNRHKLSGVAAKSRAHNTTATLHHQQVCSPPFTTLSAVDQGQVAVKEKIDVEGSRVLKEGRKVAVLGYGATVLKNCLAAAAILTVHGLSITVVVADATVAADDVMRRLAQHHQLLLTVHDQDDATSTQHYLNANANANGLQWSGITLPRPASEKAAGLNSKHIAATVLSLVSHHQDVFLIM